MFSGVHDSSARRIQGRTQWNWEESAGRAARRQEFGELSCPLIDGILGQGNLTRSGLGLAGKAT